MLQKAVVHRGIHLGNTDSIAEISDGGRGIPSSSQAAQGGHSGIIPAGYVTVFHQSPQLSFTHHRMVNAQSGEFDLPRLTGAVHIINHPVVQRPMVLKLQGT